MGFANTSQFVIIGAGQAGGWAAKTLRDGGFEGRIVLVSDEPHPPYERPPLSKAVLTAAKPPESCYLWSRDRLRELSIELQEECAVDIERGRHEVALSSGRRIRYDRLLIATGSRPRRLACPGASLPGVHYLRTIQDSVAIGRTIQSGNRLLVVGGGWIGLEVAASAASKGAAVTVVEASDRLCGRSLPVSLGRYFLELHQAHGVDIRLNAKLDSFAGEGRLERVVFAGGEEIEACAAVVGIGVEPNVDLAARSGLEVRNGIVVNEHARTSDPDIFAAGDVANQPFAVPGGRMRFESWKNAQDHGIAAAKAMLDQEPPKREIPWFWSDQYEVNFQMLGLPGADSLVFQKGDPASGGFVHYFVQDKLLSAVAAVNSPRDLRDAKRAMAAGQPFNSEGLTAVSQH
jgi:3-phenylpropionate/trans-cinnamate dioxygenase ferredoxin reductase component